MARHGSSRRIMITADRTGSRLGSQARKDGDFEDIELLNPMRPA